MSPYNLKISSVNFASTWFISQFLIKFSKTSSHSRRSVFSRKYTHHGTNICLFSVGGIFGKRKEIFIESFCFFYYECLWRNGKDKKNARLGWEKQKQHQSSACHMLRYKMFKWLLKNIRRDFSIFSLLWEAVSHLWLQGLVLHFVTSVAWKTWMKKVYKEMKIKHGAIQYS